MNACGKIALCVLILAMGGTIFIPLSGHGEQNTIGEIRAGLQREGIKTELSDFNFSVSREVQDRSAVLCADGGRFNPQRPVSYLSDADLMTPAGHHAAIVLWQQEALAYPAGFQQYSYQYQPGSASNVWPILQESLDDARPQLDAAAAAALSGPIGFNLDARNGSAMLLPHLAGLKYFTDMLGARAMLSLHDHQADAAWTNLLAATRILTAWQAEPTEVSQYVRFDLAQKVYNFTWQALQAGNWSENRLVRLQHEWESLDFLKSLPDVEAFTDACYLNLCEMQNEPLSEAGEKDLLLASRDRQTLVRKVIQCKSLEEVCRLPGMTNLSLPEIPIMNLPAFVRMRLSNRRMIMSHLDRGIGLFGRAAEAETRRRLILAAIALERFHLRHGQYAKDLAALTPDFSKTVPVDFMNGQPLHYSLSGDCHYLLYSVGLDRVDNDGRMPPVTEAHALPGEETKQPESDIVWPLPASVAAARDHAADEAKRIQQALAAANERGAKAAAEAEAAARAAVKKLLHDPKYKKATWTGADSKTIEPSIKGQPLSKLLRNEKSTGTNRLTLDALLTLRPVVTGDEPEVITCQLPINYDALKDIGMFGGAHLTLAMDNPPDDDGLSQPELEGCERATNGDCLLAWNAAFERPELHAMQAVLMVSLGMENTITVKGPALAFSSTNLCRFIPASSLFDDKSAYLFAETVEPGATFSIEIKTRTGQHVKTLSGSTTNGVIDLEWNLLDEKGNRYTNNSFDSYFHVTLTRSGRSQTLKQPQNKLGTRGD